MDDLSAYPLRDRLLSMYSHRGDGIPTQHRNPDGPEAAARIAELEAQVEQAHREGELAGVRMGIEAAAKACRQVLDEFAAPEYRDRSPSSSVGERYACRKCCDEITALDPAVIAREALGEE